MVVRLRLQRFGAKNLPFYRIVAADARCKRDGKCIERIGTYNPVAGLDGVKEITANSERIQYWLSVGAQPSERVAWLLSKIDLLPPPPVRKTTKHALPKELMKKKA